MTKTNKTCTECGVRLTEGAEQCTHCGWPLDVPESSLFEQDVTVPEEGGVSAEAVSAEAVASSPPTALDKPGEEGAGSVFCNQCGWKNPPGARFCSTCGSPLQVVAASVPDVAPTTTAIPPTRADPTTPEAKAVQAASEHKAVTRQVGIIVGAGALLVVTLFLVTAVSKTQPASPPNSATQQQASSPALPVDTPLPAQLAEQVAAIEDDMSQLDGEMRVTRQRDLVPLFFGAGRLDRAAIEQEKIAQTTGTLDDWKRAGDLFYDWMNTLQDGESKAQAAARSIEAYQVVLEQNPDNNDVRTDMATAYLSTGNPMQGVTEIKRVLDAEPNHLHARFNYGLMLTWINRPDQALEQFEMVKSLVEETSDYYQRAEEAIRIIQQGNGNGI